MSINIKGLHHNAYRCRDSEETREFYEDFLGLPLAEAFQSALDPPDIDEIVADAENHGVPGGRRPQP